MSRREIEGQLRWLMTFRVVIVATLLVAAFGIVLLLRPDDTLRPLFQLSAVAFGMVLVYGVLDRWLHGTRTFIAIQLVGDALLITFFVGITGGLDSPMSFLYLLPISVGSMLLYRRGGLALAGVCWVLYGAMVVLAPSGAPFEVAWELGLPREPGRIVYTLVAHLVAMVAFALLASALSERLRVQGRELDERRGAVVRLKALNENIISSINSGLITTNLAGQINFMNRGGSDIIRLDSREVEDSSVDELFRLEQGFLHEVRRQLRVRRRFRFERYFDAPSGRRIFLGFTASNLHDKAGRPLGYIFIFQDLTDIHALEQDMRLKERMVALGEMAAGMAHELRNPLAAMSGSVQYLKENLSSDGETLELMDIILRESHRLDQAIRDFLTFARPGEFTPEPADVVKVIEDSVKLLRKSREFTEAHRIVTDYRNDRIDCEIDPNRMKQVFWNLATNGLKAMPGGGTLAIIVALDDSGSRVKITFADDGVGMDARQRENYFQPFSSSFREGTGLGTAIVYRLVEEHGGRIHVDSSEGRGTSVRITLPRKTVESALDESPHPDIRIRAAGGNHR